MEGGETVEQAAKRELMEESGVTARELSLRGQLIFHVPSYPSTMVKLPLVFGDVVQMLLAMNVF